MACPTGNGLPTMHMNVIWPRLARRFMRPWRVVVPTSLACRLESPGPGDARSAAVDVRPRMLSMDERPRVLSMDERPRVLSMDERPRVLSMDLCESARVPMRKLKFDRNMERALRNSLWQRGEGARPSGPHAETERENRGGVVMTTSPDPPKFQQSKSSPQRREPFGSLSGDTLEFPKRGMRSRQLEPTRG